MAPGPQGLLGRGRQQGSLPAEQEGLPVPVGAMGGQESPDPDPIRGETGGIHAWETQFRMPSGTG